MRSMTLTAFFDELEKIAFDGPGSLAGRQAAGAGSSSAQASISNLVGGGSLGSGPGGGGAGNAASPPPAPSVGASGGGGDPLGGAGKSLSQKELGIPGSSPF